MNKNSRYFAALVDAIAGGSSIRDAATLAGCSESTGYRICRSPEFITRVGEIRTDATGQAIGRLTRLAANAAMVLESVMDDKAAKAGDRINAAKAVLTLLGPLCELHELRIRIDKLEQSQSGRAAA